MEHSFSYSGPIEAVDDRLCSYCTAIAAKKCNKTVQQHGSDPHSCPECQLAAKAVAGKSVVCPNHAGLAKALAQHAQDYPTHVSPRHDAAAAFAKALVATMPPETKTVHVHISGYHEQPDPELPLSGMTIHFEARK